MTEKDYLKKYNIKLLILSRGRANSITTNKILPEWVEILVPDDEIEQYKATVENPLLTIPTEIKGLGKVRNWVLDNFKEETIIMIDDDITHLYCLTGEKTRDVTDEEEVVQVLINTAVMAKDLNCHCFGFSQTDIRKYNATEPFKFNSWIGGVIGIIGRKYRFRNDKYKVDIDYCLQCLLVDRIIFQDCRYFFWQNRDNNKGGNSSFRTEEEYNKSIETLCDKWGDCLKISNQHKSQVKINLNVKRKQAIKYE